MKTDIDKIEKDILVALSDFIPKNQNQMADLIGKDHKKSTDRVHVSRSLEVIEPFLKRVPNQNDELGKIWVLKNDIETIKQIIEKYPSLIPDLQKNELILDMLLDKHPELCLKEIPSTTREMVREKAKEIPGFEETFEGLMDIESGKKEFKKYLKSSPAFFKMCLLNDIKYITQKVSYIYHGFANEYVFDEEQLKTIYREYVPQFRASNMLYKFCVIMDAL